MAYRFKTPENPMSKNKRYPRIAQYKEPAALRARFAELGFELPCDAHIEKATDNSPLASPIEIGGFMVGNRWCIHPMEGWDANLDGSPTDLTLRRWRNFGLSGAKLIWGGEAAAVQPDGRANPHQTLAVCQYSSYPATTLLYQATRFSQHIRLMKG